MPEAPEAWVWLARIRRTQGRKGEVFADILTDFPEKFTERRHVWLLPPQPGPSAPSRSVPGKTQTVPSSPREVELIHHWPHKGGIVLHFAGVDSISAAETLAGTIVAIPHTERAALQQDESYIGDLIGCVLVDVHETVPLEVGTVEDVDQTAGPVPLLIVHGTKGEVLVPFAKNYLRTLDLAAKRIEMALPEGLVDLNVRENR